MVCCCVVVLPLSPTPLPRGERGFQQRTGFSIAHRFCSLSPRGRGLGRGGSRPAL
ncbi:hypothetical protein VITFI_CDS2033 [Vitreoscilla filiformis]|uniref:Uncharacterized protein n=1 Tax=Vitreoscilla filiformis TaxID=63 RepID=A0A221KFL3_VITFI|nr:hypothetical protein VITFI_CDS2033 [Vitreoscilla filiformis]